jgi:hypothetical protein
MIEVGSGIGDAASGFLVPADNDNRKPLSGLARQGTHQQNSASAVTAYDKSSAAHGKMRVSGNEISEVTLKSFSNSNPKVTFALNARNLPAFSSQRRNIATT